VRCCLTTANMGSIQRGTAPAVKAGRGEQMDD
jgi:hypothetical protein